MPLHLLSINYHTVLDVEEERDIEDYDIDDIPVMERAMMGFY